MKFNSLTEFSPVSWQTSDGTGLTLRHITADDGNILMSFVNGLSFGTRYFRYGHGDREFSPDKIQNLCMPNPSERVHFLVLKANGEGETVVASARIIFEENGASCEVAITVADAWQLHGIGKRLIDALFVEAKARNLTEMHGEILSTNRRMIEFMRRRGFAINNSPETPSLKIAQINL